MDKERYEESENEENRVIALIKRNLTGSRKSVTVTGPSDLLNVTDAQSLLLNMYDFTTYDKFRQYQYEMSKMSKQKWLNPDSFCKKKYVNLLVAQGRYKELKDLMDTDKKLPRILNTWSINEDVFVFHTILQWNINEKAEQLFDLLLSYGVKICKDNNMDWPWEYQSEEWLDPIDSFKKLGNRNRKEFIHSHLLFYYKYEDRYKTW